MKKLIKSSKIFAASSAKYVLNEFTTEHGTIIFDKSKGGNVTNSFIYRIGFEKYGHIDIYIDKNYKIINSIWFVSLKSTLFYLDSGLDFQVNNNFEIPFFDTSIWNNDIEELWEIVYNKNAIEVYHNGMNCIYICFGDKYILCPLNDSIQLQYDKNNGL